MLYIYYDTGLHHTVKIAQNENENYIDSDTKK